MHYTENTIYYEDTLMTYVREYQHITLSELPFNEVDALLLCQMVYPRVELLVPKLKSAKAYSSGKQQDSHVKNASTPHTSIHFPQQIPTIGWSDMDTPEKREMLFGESFYGLMYRDLFDEIKDSARYGQIRLGCMKAMTDQKKTVQFAALTMWLDQNHALVIFRGTDSSLIGWREDFKYSYLKTWPAHAIAREYLLDVSKLFPEHIYVAGHSKGGNLAVYASSLVSASCQKRIRRVFSYDGMGFRSSFYRTDGYERIRGRVFKLVPAESLIGMLFVPERGFKIVESYEHGFLQHDLMNWKVRDGQFVLREHFSKKQNRLINRLNRWLLSMNGKERKGFVELLFSTLGDLLESEGAQTMTESGSLVKTLRSRLKKLSKQERKLFWRTVRRFALPKKPPHTRRKRGIKNET